MKEEGLNIRENKLTRSSSSWTSCSFSMAITNSVSSSEPSSSSSFAFLPLSIMLPTYSQNALVSLTAADSNPRKLQQKSPIQQSLSINPSCQGYKKPRRQRHQTENLCSSLPPRAFSPRALGHLETLIAACRSCITKSTKERKTFLYTTTKKKKKIEKTRQYITIDIRQREKKKTNKQTNCSRKQKP